MARLNIEDSIFKDKRFSNLMIKTGSLEMALGSLVRAWMVAQEFWKKDRSRIPKEVWIEQELNDALIDVGLVKWDEEYTGFYVSGSENQFDWLISRSEGGSKISEKKLKQLSAARLSKSTKNQQVTSELIRTYLKSSEAPTLTPSLPLTLSLTQDNILCSELEKPSPSKHQFPEFSFFESISVIKQELIESWIKAYDRNWIFDELRKAESWVLANPRKRPRNASRFLNSWFANGWERYRKTISSEKPKLDYSILK